MAMQMNSSPVSRNVSKAPGLPTKVAVGDGSTPMMTFKPAPKASVVGVMPGMVGGGKGKGR